MSPKIRRALFSILGLLAAFELLALTGCQNRAAEAQVRAIIEKHKEEIAECDQVGADAYGMLNKSYDAMKAGNSQGAEFLLGESQRLLRAYGQCITTFRSKLQKEFNAARLPSDTVNKVWQQWWKEKRKKDKPP